MSRLDEDKNIPIDKDKDKDKTICLINIKDKDKTKSECKDEDMLSRVYSKEELVLIKNIYWIRKKKLMVFWNNNIISELCEKWIFYNDNYTYTKFEELRTRSGELLYTREHKATLSKEKSSTYIDIDELKIYSDENIFKTKKEYIDMLDKVNNRINNVNDANKIITKTENELKKKIKSIYELIFKLSDDSWLRQVELNTIDAKIDDALNFVWNKIYRKNRISSEKINRDKHKDIDEHIISNKLKLLVRMNSSINNIISEIKNKIKMIYKDMYKFYEEGIDQIYLINDKLNKIMRQSNKDLKNIISLADLLQK